MKFARSTYVCLMALATCSLVVDSKQPAFAANKSQKAALAQVEQERFQFALLQQRKQNYSGALFEYDRLLLQAPRNADYMIGKAQALLKLERVPEAQSLLTRAVSIAPNYEFGWSLLLASCNSSLSTLHSQDFVAAARRHFPHALWLPLKEPLNDADLSQKISQLSHATSDFDKFRLAQYLLKAHRPKEAVPILNALRKHLPDEPLVQTFTAKAYRDLGKEQWAAGDVAAAALSLQQAIELAPDEPSAYRLYLQTNRSNSDKPDVEATRRQAQALFPTAYWAQTPLPPNASAVLLQSRIDQLNAALLESPDDVAGVLELGRLRQQLQLDPLIVYERYLSQFSQAAMPMDAVDVLNAKAALLNQRAKVAESVQTLRQIIALKPDTESAWRLWLKLCKRPGCTDSYEAVKQQALVHFPNAFWLRDGSVSLNADGTRNTAEIAQRIREINACLERQPDDAEAYLSLSKLQESLGDYEQAIATNQKLLSMAPDEPEYRQRQSATYFALAKSLVRKSNEVSIEAVRTLEQAIAIDPSYEPASKLHLKWSENPANHVVPKQPSTQTAQLFCNAYWFPANSSAASAPADLQRREEGIQRYAERYPEDFNANYDLFQVYRAQHKNELALGVIDNLLLDSPNEREYIFCKINLLNAMNRPADAIAFMEGAVRNKQLAVTPAYYQVLLKNQLQQKDWLSYHKTYKRARAHEPQYDWSAYNPHNLEGNVFPRQELDIIGNAQQLTRGRPGWNEQTIAYSLRMPNRVTFVATANRYHRFNVNDNTYTAGIGLPLSRRLSTYTEGLIGPHNTALPKMGLLQALTINLPFQVNAILAYQHNSYRLLSTNSGIFTLEKYAGPFRLAYTFNNAHIEHTGVANAHSVTLNWFYKHRSQIGLSLAAGRNLELILPQNKILDKPTLGASFGGLHYVTPEWGIRYGVFIDGIQDVFTRKGAYLGVKRVL